MQDDAGTQGGGARPPGDVVVGVDGSAAATRALERALAQARLSGRPLRVVHAWLPPAPLLQPAGMLLTYAATARTARQREALVAVRLLEQVDTAGVRLRTELVEGACGPALVHLSTEAALLVVGTGRHGPVTGRLLGSSTTYVLDHSACPVLVVGAGAPAPDRFARVVVGVDGSASARAALRWAAGQADEHGCPLVVAYCWRTDAPHPPPPMSYLSGRDEYRDAADRWLHEEVAQVLAAGAPVRHLLVHSAPTAALPGLAGPDELLVVGRHGRGRLAAALLGSVSSTCARHARGTLAVVPPPAA